MVYAIVAVDNDFGIGFNNDLLEHIPNDLKNFKNLTTGNVVVMGRKTLDSFPNGPLPKRLNIVITNQKDLSSYKNVQYFSLEEAKSWIENNKNQSDIFIIGGASIYEQLLPLCEKIYLTKIYLTHSDVDTYFPRIDKDIKWQGCPIGEVQEYKDISYQFWCYSRI